MNELLTVKFYFAVNGTIHLSVEYEVEPEEHLCHFPQVKIGENRLVD